MNLLPIISGGIVLGLLAWLFWPVSHPSEKDLPKVGETVDVIIRSELWPFKVTRVDGSQVWGESLPHGPKGYVVSFGEKPLSPTQYVRRR